MSRAGEMIPTSQSALPLAAQAREPGPKIDRPAATSISRPSCAHDTVSRDPTMLGPMRMHINYLIARSASAASSLVASRERFILVGSLHYT